MWQEYINALLGLVLVVVAFMSLEGATLMWTVGAIGIAVLVLSLWSASKITTGGEFEHRHA